MRGWPAADVREMAAYLAREPDIGARLDEWMPRLLAALVAPWAKERAEPRDFHQDRWADRPARPKSRAGMKAMLKGWALALGGGGEEDSGG